MTTPIASASSAFRRRFSTRGRNARRDALTVAGAPAFGDVGLPVRGERPTAYDCVLNTGRSAASAHPTCKKRRPPTPAGRGPPSPQNRRLVRASSLSGMLPFFRRSCLSSTARRSGSFGRVGCTLMRSAAADGSFGSTFEQSSSQGPAGLVVQPVASSDPAVGEGGPLSFLSRARASSPRTVFSGTTWIVPRSASS